MGGASALGEAVQPPTAPHDGRVTPIVLTVQGTNDADTSNESERWWQRGSVFALRLAAELSHRGVDDVKIRPVHWSGANSDNDRLLGAESLAKSIAALARTDRPFVIVGHSHGGNVAIEALGRSHARREHAGIVNFGTPFFLRRLKLVPKIIAWFQILLGVTMTPVLAGYIVAILSYADKTSFDKLAIGLLFFGGIAALCIWSSICGARKLTSHRRAERRVRAVVSGEQWLVVQSPRYEAMRLLETADQLKPAYVTAAWGVRAVSRFAPLAGIVAVAAVLALTGRYFLQPIIDKVSAGEFSFGLAADFTFILLVPVVYFLAWCAVWILARVGGCWLYAAIANRMISAGLVGAVYGGDAEDVLMRVTRLPPLLGKARELCIEALQLGGIDDKAIFESAQKVY
jgi:hypothetical protein